jgi:hypothetical protein
MKFLSLLPLHSDFLPDFLAMVVVSAVAAQQL